MVRHGSSTVQPNEDVTRDLFAQAAQVPFDDRVNHTADVADLNPALVRSFLHETSSALEHHMDSMPFVDICDSLQIINAQPEYRKPKNVGLLFFSMQPDKYFPYAQIDVVDMTDETGTNISERTFRGPIQQQLREALQYIQNMYITEEIHKVEDRPEAERHFNYPFPAVEEALANAVYHKGYDVREPIEVRIQTNEIAIVSYPGAHRSISRQDLEAGNVLGRRYRNRRIGEFLKDLRLTEGRNTGLKKIRVAMQRNGSPPPVFETDDDRTYFATRLPIWIPLEGNVPARQNEEQKEEESNGNDKSTSLELNEPERKLREYVMVNPYATNAQVAEALSMSRRTLDRTIRSLTAKGVLKKEGPPRKRLWNILA